MSKKRTTNRVNFGQRALAALPIPAKSRVYVFDTKVPGLALCITPGGARSYYLYRWVKGKPQRLRIAAFGEISVEQARRRAAWLNNEIAAGGNPQTEKRRARDGLTLGELFETWLETYAKVHKRTWRADEWQFGKYLAPVKGKRLSDMGTANVQALHTGLGKKHGPYTANRVRALLATLFNHAVRAGLVESNPCAGVRKFPERSRERFLIGDELTRFLQAVRAETDPMIRDFVLLAMLTGARRGNLQGMKWGDVNLTAGIWQITAAESKNAEALVVVLSVPAVAILKHRRADLNGYAGPWVFPSARSRCGHIVELKTAWARILKTADLADVRMHDLRRGLGSFLALGGASLVQVGKALGHRSQQASAVYARLQTEAVRGSVEAACAKLLEAAPGIAGAPNAIEG